MAASLSGVVLKELRALQNLAGSLKNDSEDLSDASTEKILADTPACVSQGDTQHPHTNGATAEAQTPRRPILIISSSLGSRRKASLLNLSMSWSARSTADPPAMPGAASASFYGGRQMQDDLLDVLAAALHESFGTFRTDPFHTDGWQEHTKVITSPPKQHMTSKIYLSTQCLSCYCRSMSKRRMWSTLARAMRPRYQILMIQKVYAHAHVLDFSSSVPAIFWASQY